MGGKNSKDETSPKFVEGSNDNEVVTTLGLRKSIESILSQDIFLDDPQYRKRLEKYYAKRKQMVEKGLCRFQENPTSDSALLKRNKCYGCAVSSSGTSEPNLKAKASLENKISKTMPKNADSEREKEVMVKISDKKSPTQQNVSSNNGCSVKGKAESVIVEDSFKKQIHKLPDTTSTILFNKKLLNTNPESSTSHNPSVGGDHSPTRTSVLQAIDMSMASNPTKPTQKQRSAFTTKLNKPPDVVLNKRNSEERIVQKPKNEVKASTSTGKDWAPVKYSYSQSSRPGTATLEKSAIPQIEKPSHSSLGSTTTTATTNSETCSENPRNKLVVRGLKSFVNSRRRTPTTPSTIGSYTSSSSSFSSGPKLWNSEFPVKGKFHPDNYIYEFEEGPKRPTRPYSAMAKCRRHGGKCDNCGIFTCDLCQSCRKCEVDCDCPNKGTAASSSYPYTCPAEVYSQVFGGDAWKKTCKVFCDLTEKEKMNPVGGNGSKWSQIQKGGKRMDPTGRNNMYNSQIDVLNPYKRALEDESSRVLPPMTAPPTYPMCSFPPMYPMSFMPMMMPPFMPYAPAPYYPPPLPMVSSPPPFFPPSDPFLPPPQNYV